MTITDYATGKPYHLRVITYTVPAASIPGATYRVSVDESGWRCECAGWRWRHRCRHLDECRAGKHGRPVVAVRPVATASALDA